MSQAFCRNAVTLSQFCQSRMRAAISATIPTTTHVMGFASSAAVKDHTEAINPGMAVTAVTTACLAMLTRPSAMFFRAVTPEITAVFAMPGDPQRHVFDRGDGGASRCSDPVKTVSDRVARFHAVQGYGLKQVRQSPDDADEAFDQSGGLGENDPHAADYGDAGARHSQEAAQGQGRKQDDPDKVLVVLYPLRALLDDAGSAFHQVVDHREQCASRRFGDVVELLLEPFKFLRLCLVHGGRHF